MTDLTPTLQFLRGEQLSAVSFVMDYVELHFDGSYLRCLEPPTVVRRDALPVTFPAAGSRDALCSVIGAAVQAIQAVDGGELRVDFSDGTLITASLSHEARSGPEALHFHNRNNGETQWW
jgi:hypothetical protein